MRDDYGSKFSDIFGHIPNTSRCFEDLVYSRKYKEHFTLVRDAPLKKDIFHDKHSHFFGIRSIFRRILTRSGADTRHTRLPSSFQHYHLTCFLRHLPTGVKFQLPNCCSAKPFVPAAKEDDHMGMDNRSRRTLAPN
jgi:hypothetical protein